MLTSTEHRCRVDVVDNNGLDMVNVVDAFVGRYLCPRSAQKTEDWGVGESDGFVILQRPATSSSPWSSSHRSFLLRVIDDSVGDELFDAPISLATVLMVAWKDSIKRNVKSSKGRQTTLNSVRTCEPMIKSGCATGETIRTPHHLWYLE